MSAVLPTSAAPVTAPKAAAVPSSVPRDAIESDKGVDRLALSRARLRGAMMDISHPPKPSSPLAHGIGGLTRQLADRVKALPGAAIIVDSIEGWWAQHPLHTAASIANEASRGLVGPVAQRNPFGLIFGALAVGGLFALTKPWKWLLRPALLIGFVPQVLGQAVKRMPLETWLKMASTVSRQGTRRSTGARAAPAKPPLEPRVSSLP